MRNLTGLPQGVVWTIGLTAALFHLWTAGFGFLEPREQRSIHLLMLMPLAFLLFPAGPKAPQDRPSPMDWLLAAISTTPSLYSYFAARTINMRMENVDPLSTLEIVVGCVLVVTLLEALRRAVTPILAGLMAIGITYLFVTEYLPGILHYRNMPFPEIVENMYLLNGMGAFGSITGISATMVATFIVFGAFIEGSGVGRLFHNLGMKVAGRQSGGPAKVEVISSSLFGTISGSSVANVFATGSFTIPAMIKLGYRRHFAAGVEAASSVGGQIMPPVMGAGAFVMAEITNIPYSTIAVSAILGSVLFYFMVLVSVHFEAKRLKLEGCAPEEIPGWDEILRDAHLLLPVFLLVGLLMWGYSPTFSAFWAVLSLPPVTWLRHHTRLYPRDVLNMLAKGGCNMAIVALACAGAGIFVACLTVTGLVIALSSQITALAGQSVLIAGVLLMITTLILGMGVPTTAAYIIGAAIGAPILQKMGVPPLQAHMFIFYFAILADATPPVSVASYAAASIAKADPMQSGFAAFRLAAAGFVVGFSYLHSGALLLNDTPTEIIGEFLVIAIALSLMAAGAFGYFRAPLSVPIRLVLAPLGLTLALLQPVPVLLRVAIAAGIAIGLFLWQGRSQAEESQP
jgi:TRAP transporter 4TM/12TM fusion protein